MGHVRGHFPHGGKPGFPGARLFQSLDSGDILEKNNRPNDLIPRADLRICGDMDKAVISSHPSANGSAIKGVDKIDKGSPAGGFSSIQGQQREDVLCQRLPLRAACHRLCGTVD